MTTLAQRLRVELALEKRIVAAAAVFVLTLFGLIALTIRLFGIGLPTCITDVQPFDKGNVLVQSPTWYEIHYVARMWSFDPPDVTIPAGARADIYLSTADVTHGFQILGTNVNLMAVPGTVNYARVKFDQPGEYYIVCHEYCGTGHQNMTTTIRVTPRNLMPSEAADVTAQAVAGHPGRGVLEARACLACHTIDGRPSVGPTFKGLYGRKENLESGGTAVADENYIRESIRAPQAKVVKGFPPAMPALPLTDSEVNVIIDYFKTLK
jgi:cytochrome c oxidase subunit 2